MSFLSELKRRNVFRLGLAYVLGAWVLLQIVEFFLEVFNAPTWILQLLVLIAALGLPVVLVFGWVFELTPEGLKRESEIDRSHSVTPQTGRKLDRVIIALLALTIVVLLAERFLRSDRIDGSTAGSIERDSAAAPVAGRSAAMRSVAVLPFLALSSGVDDEYFADGLTEEVLNALSQLPELLVTARTSAFHFKGRDLPVQEIADQLGVRHIVEGSVRRAGERLRVTAQLVRASDGFHVWSENYDSTAADTIAVQQDIAEKIALAMDVVIDDDKRERMRRAGLRDAEAFIALQKALQLYDHAHGADDMIAGLRQANRYLEVVQQRVPDYAAAYQLHSDLYIHLLMNQAIGLPLGDVTEQEMAQAMTRAEADYRAVVARAHTAEERNNADLDLAFIASDWQGMPARIERFTRESGCSMPTWIDNIALPFGYALQITPRLREFRICDPLRMTKWMSESRSLLWAGQPEAALDIAREGMQTAPGDWLQMQLITNLVALKQFDAAEREIAIGIKSRTNTLALGMMRHAAQGERDKSEALFSEFVREPLAGRFWELSYYAWIGDAVNANRTAAVMDAVPFAGPALVTTILWCNCGAPWDLAATPTLAGLINDAGLTWPPASPIRFPLKTW